MADSAAILTERLIQKAVVQIGIKSYAEALCITSAEAFRTSIKLGLIDIEKRLLAQELKIRLEVISLELILREKRQSPCIQARTTRGRGSND